MKNSGFSLIEVVLVIAILGTLLAMAGLSGKTWIERYRVEGQTKELYADLMNARASALQKSRVYFVTVTGTQYTIYEDRDPGHSADPAYDGDGVYEPSDKLVVQKNTQYSIVTAMTATNGTFGSFNFDRSGLVSLNGTLHFDLTGSTLDPAYDCITLSTTRILMGKWSETGCVNQ